MPKGPPWLKHPAPAGGNIAGALGKPFEASEPEPEEAPETEAAQRYSRLGYALRYAAMGWRVFPAHSIREGVCSCGDAECKSAGKHPRTQHGRTEATTDLDAIRAWWARWPDAHVAVATGEASGIWVLDIDVTTVDGRVQLDAMEDRHGALPDTCRAATGRGGMHYVFRHVPGLRNRARIAPGIDIRAEGGHVIVEPSKGVLYDYSWQDDTDPLEDGLAPAEAPAWLVDLARDRSGTADGPVAAPSGEPIPDGQRNHTLASLAGHLRQLGLSPTAIEAALQQANVERCQPPLGVREVRAVAESIARYTPDYDWAERARVDISGLLPGQAPGDALEALVASSWAGQEPAPREWLVPDWLPMRQTTALYAPGGTGKTLLVQQLMTAVASGAPWLGLEGLQQGPALGVFCEDDLEELHRRQAGINEAMGVSWESLAGMHVLARVGHDNTLMDYDARGHGQLTPFWTQLRELAQRVQPRLLVVDTAADVFAGNENIRPQVRQFVQRALTALAAELDCAVLLCAHPSTAGVASGAGSGGSTAWENTVRARLYMHRDPDTKRITLTRKKANYAASGDQHAIDLLWHDGALKPYTTVATDILDQHQREREIQIETDALDLIDLTYKHDQKLSMSKMGGNWAPKVLERKGKARRPALKWTVEDYEDAIERLLADGQIELSGDPKREGKTVRRIRSDDA